MLSVIGGIWRRLIRPTTTINVYDRPPYGQPPPYGQSLPYGRGQTNLPGPSPYRCWYCKTNFLLKRTVRHDNPHNANRPYYVCVDPNCPNVTGPNARHEPYTGWVTWDDNRGIKLGNPLCQCPVPQTARLDTAWTQENYNRDFWTCATGACNMNYAWVDGR